MKQTWARRSDQDPSLLSTELLNPSTNSLIGVPDNIGQLAGPLLVGYLLNWGLFGVLSTQMYIYYLTFPDDHAWSKVAAYSIYVLEAIQTFILTQSAFHTFAEGFGNLLTLDDFGTVWFSIPILSAIVAAMAQILYAYRIRILSKSIIIASVVLTLALVQLGGGIAMGIVSKRAQSSSKFVGAELYITTGVWNGCSALCDVIIAACMIFYLTRQHTGLPRTRRLVTKIVRLTVETGSLTAAVALINFTLTLVPGHLTYYRATASIVGKLYSNSLMAMFNSRLRLVAYSGTTPHSVAFSNIVFDRPQEENLCSVESRISNVAKDEHRPKEEDDGVEQN